MTVQASPMNRPFIAQRLASQLGTLTAVAGADAATENRPAKVAQVAQPVARRPIAPLPVSGWTLPPPSARAVGEVEPVRVFESAEAAMAFLDGGRKSARQKESQ
jgi:hypothetical protein